MIIWVHQYFLNNQQCQKQYQNLSLCKEVAMVFEATLARVVVEHSKSKNDELSLSKIIGQPKKKN